MAQALYRKYRSRSFDELVGQNHVTKTLSEAVKRGKISHAYLFTGPRGIGKTSVARILAYAVNELEYSDKPHLDIIEIDAASNRRIEDVRDLREKVHVAPVSAKYKVYIIDEVHMLTNESFNALLKTLEEPPAHVVFILATTELHKLPATITSRTQRFAFAPPSKEIITVHLKKLAKQENIDISPEALELLADHADGSFRDSISLLDQVSAAGDGKNKINEEAVANLLGLPPKTSVAALLEAVFSHRPKEVAEQLAALKSAGISAATIASALARLAAESAPTEPAAVRLLDALLAVERHSYPAAKLLAVLLEAAHRGTPTETPSSPRQKSAPLQVTGQLDNFVATSEKPKKKTKAVATTEGKATPKDWSDVLSAMQSQSAPLRGTLKNAEVRISGDTVTLAFKYSLHSKKIENSKHKSTIAAAFESVLDMKDVTIETVVDPAAVPTPVDTTPKIDSRAAAIIDVMGGGEMVHYN